jgi:putative nucleotidyltransferase with HDIG domain
LSSLRNCWRHSLATALLAERLAGPAGIDVDRAYTSGLLHDIGLLGFLVNYPSSYAAMVEVTAESDFDLRVAEQALFDVDHCHAGAWIARQWNLGADIHDAALGHHAPPKAGDHSLVSVIYWASLLADSLGYQVTCPASSTLRSPADVRGQLPEALQAAFGESPELFAQQLAVRVNSLE